MDMDHSPAATPATLTWKKIAPDFLLSMTPGTYLLRKDSFNEPNYYATLTGVYDGYSGRIKFVFTERDEVPHEVLQRYARDETGGRDEDVLHRKVFMASFKFKCLKYNSYLDCFPMRSRGDLIRLNYETKMAAKIANLQEELNMVFDSFSVIRTEVISPASICQDIPDEGGPTKRKANDDDEQEVGLNDKRMKMT